MKILFLATYGDFLATFELSNINLWIELGCIVHCASNFTEKKYNLKTEELDKIGVIKHEIDFTRNPFDKSNLKSYKQLVKLIKKEHIDVIDSHNAIIGAYARVAASQCHIEKVIYTPHSFFFYEGCPLKNLLIYKNIESILATKTDLLITINNEDYESAKKMKVRGKAIYVPGVGVNTQLIEKLPQKRDKYRKEFGIPKNAKLFISVGELIKRKNHEIAIRAFCKANIENSYYVICGIGELDEKLHDLIEDLGMSDRIKLLGYRLDAKEIMKASDVFFFPSIQEGLPVALIEAMSAGLPCILSRIRGNIDLIEDNEGGIFFDPYDVQSVTQALKTFDRIDQSIILAWEKRNIHKAKDYDISNVRQIMKKEYSEFLVN